MDSRLRGNDKKKEKEKKHGRDAHATNQLTNQPVHSYPIDGRNSVVSRILTNKHTGLQLGRQNVNPHFF